MTTIGEERVTSAGNVYKLIRMDGEWRYVKRIRRNDIVVGEQLWDSTITYRWHSSQWEEGIPLVGSDPSEYPHFGAFVPGGVL